MSSEENLSMCAKRTMIIGGGVACEMLLKEIFNAQKSPYTDDKYSAQFDPICIIDNDPKKIGKEVQGVKIVGREDEIVKNTSVNLMMEQEKLHYHTTIL